MNKPNINFLEKSSSPFALLMTDDANDVSFYKAGVVGDILNLVDVGAGVLQPQFTTLPNGTKTQVVLTGTPSFPIGTDQDTVLQHLLDNVYQGTVTGVSATGNTIASISDGQNAAVDVKETISTLTDNADNTYTFANEAGTSTTISPERSPWDVQAGTPASDGDNTTINYVGRVGIGITAPTSTLYVVGDATIDNININGSTIGTVDTSQDLIITPLNTNVDTDSADIYIRQQGGGRNGDRGDIYIQGSQGTLGARVGSDIHIEGGISGQNKAGDVFISGGDTGNNRNINLHQAAGDLVLSGGANIFDQIGTGRRNGGNVLIKPGINSANSTHNGYIDLQYYDGTTYNSSMRLEGVTGNVGIGITSPTSKLHIDGGQITLAGHSTALYDGTAVKYLGVDATDRVITFDAPAGGSTTFASLTDTPAALGTAGQSAVVNAGATALEWSTEGIDTVLARNQALTAPRNINLNGQTLSIGGFITNNTSFGVNGNAVITTGTTTPLSLNRTALGTFIQLTDGTDDFTISNTHGTPEGSVIANTGSLNTDTTNGSLYVKTEDTTNNGWDKLAVEKYNMFLYGTINQANAFADLTPLTWDGTDYTTAQSDTLANSADTIKITSIDPNNMVVGTSGVLVATAHGLNVGEWYCTPNGTGAPVAESTLLPADNVQRLFFVLDANQLQLNLQPIQI